MEENPNAGLHVDDSDQEIEYDEDGNPIAPLRKKEIDPLPAIDHSVIPYEAFEKNFYIVHDDIANLNLQQVDDLRKTLGIKVSGPSPPNPVTSFAHFGFDDSLMKAIRKHEYTQPTPIQTQAIPVALSGRDAIGIAKTGSGKTAAFIWPMLVHIMDQKELSTGDGPIGLILAPTRELSQQVIHFYNEKL
jgi:ATP-dependent RNA helicase DDX42